ncbi:hypothetical protein [Paracoccus sp. SCSIO 75233]|uniref:hypothetical protein n=1 Tax=Paracoccus sp. SCSIO 75233 TaxID=3017782 RepID=UPI0022F036E7|nr:hypothetical protein [Paracoccus sp. SCSIO 75233]WBU52470.1 hypothetical protein PAF12_11660 [Paracoccus sp. SCSIO 75233]
MSQDPGQPVETQAKRHMPALLGIAVAAVVVIVVLFIFGAFGPGDVTDEPTATTAEPAAVE